MSVKSPWSSNSRRILHIHALEPTLSNHQSDQWHKIRGPFIIILGLIQCCLHSQQFSNLRSDAPFGIYQWCWTVPLFKVCFVTLTFMKLDIWGVSFCKRCN